MMMLLASMQSKKAAKLHQQGPGFVIHNFLHLRYEKRKLLPDFYLKKLFRTLNKTTPQNTEIYFGPSKVACSTQLIKTANS
jgi:hypothetical protein